MTSLDCRAHDPVVTRHRSTLPLDVDAIARDIERAASVVAPYREHADALADRVVEVCEATYALPPGSIRGPSRSKVRAMGRQSAMWALRQAGWSHPRCARAVGRVDHTTSIAATRRTQIRNRHDAYALRRNLGVLDACGIERPEEHR